MTVFEKKAAAIPDQITTIEIRREDAMRGRARLYASGNKEIVIDLPRMEPILDGDIFGPSNDGTYYRVSILPERVMRVAFKNEDNHLIEHALKLGYNLGNRHLEALVEDNTVYLPLLLGKEKIERILRKTTLPIDLEVVDKVISPGASGYFAGEEEESP